MYIIEVDVPPRKKDTRMDPRVPTKRMVKLNFVNKGVGLMVIVVLMRLENVSIKICLSSAMLNEYNGSNKIYRTNIAEYDIQTFKNHFKAVMVIIDPYC